ncbi:MAG: dihydrofolate reductase family protein [Solirubrobacterales bacterium]|nr:dihydrofolate reductase family protein [Solirubrobacterales bacterium]
MRKLTNSTYITVDGVIQDPQDWPSLGSSDDRGQTIQTELLRSCELQIMGRRTYEGFAAVWPTRSGDPYSDHINAMRKLVFSSQVAAPSWNNTVVVAEDPVQTVRELKTQDGGDIVQYGFGHLAHQLLAAGLVDELRLWVHPFLIGRVGPEALLYRNSTTTRLNLAATTVLENGIVILTYTKAA